MWPICYRHCTFCGLRVLDKQESPAKMDELIKMPLGKQTCLGLRNHVLDVGAPGEYD